MEPRLKLHTALHSLLHLELYMGGQTESNLARKQDRNYYMLLITSDLLHQILVDPNSIHLVECDILIYCSEMRTGDSISSMGGLMLGISGTIGSVSELDINAYGTPTNPDEHGYRTGCPPPPEVPSSSRKHGPSAQCHATDAHAPTPLTGSRGPLNRI